jgi:hypothetical protein
MRDTWKVEWTDDAEAWWWLLGPEEQEAMAAAVALLAERGPELPWPLAMRVPTSRHAAVRELLVPGVDLRALFAADPEETILVLVGGQGPAWEAWLERAVELADRLYDQHLERLPAGMDR